MKILDVPDGGGQKIHPDVLASNNPGRRSGFGTVVGLERLLLAPLSLLILILWPASVPVHVIEVCRLKIRANACCVQMSAYKFLFCRAIVCSWSMVVSRSACLTDT